MFAMSIAANLFTRSVPAAEPGVPSEPITYRTLTVQSDNKVDSDLAKIDARARIVYVSSGAIAFSLRLIDNDSHTGFRFSPNDLHPTLILELAQDAPVHRIGAVFDAEEGAQLNVYLFNELPRNLVNLDGTRPLACKVVRADPNEVAVDFAPTTARYVVFRWTRQKSGKNPFRVAEVSAVGSISSRQGPLVFAENDILFASETQIDFGNNPGPLADPPSIPVVSP
jgi:hypothetical protein